MTYRPAVQVRMAMLLVVVALLASACAGGGQVTPTTLQVQPTPVISTVKPDLSPAPVETKNTLAISEPLPGATIADMVTVKGEGMAFENTITVEVVANGATLGRSIVTTDAQPGAVGKFTATVTIGPVGADTSGLVTIYTTSAKDGSIDQRASVPVKIKAHGQTPSTGAYTTHPNIIISPTRGRSGNEVTVVGSGFRAGSVVQVRLGTINAGAAPQVYATTEAGEHGNIQASFIMPFHWPSGEEITLHQVVIVASSPDFIDKATAQFTFETPTPSPQFTATPTP
jgi:hypothetical protein